LIEIESKIKEDSHLVKIVEAAGKDKNLQKDLNSLAEQLRLGNKSPGTATKTLFKDVKEARAERSSIIFPRKKRIKMLLKKINFPSPLEDIYDDNIDVFVELEDESQYTVIVGTTEKFLTLMSRNEMDFLKPCCPFILVKKLTMEVIEKAIHAHTQDDAYWLKLHHFSASIDSAMFNKLQEKQDKLHDFFDID
jgi:hypothetical protein